MRTALPDPTYLPATATNALGGVDILGVAPVDDSDICALVDYHDPDSLILRTSREQAHHLYLALGHTLRAMGVI